MGLEKPVSSVSSPPSTSSQDDVDVVVVGAGFAGVYMLYKLRELGLKARVFEAGDDVGGTWYWNCYPGARCDTQSIEYCYSFSREVGQEWTWTERYASQPEIQRYIKFVTDRFNLRPFITFKTRVTSMVYDDANNRWVVSTDRGDAVVSRLCVSAVGCLSLPVLPKFPGMEKFAGNVYHSGNWPREAVDFSGQRVGVIGTGSSGMQLVPALAKQAGEVYVFQRTANHAMPARNYPLPESYTRRVKQRYDELWKKWLSSPNMTSNSVAVSSALDVTDEERQAVYEYQWSKGGYDILFSFDDIFLDQAANDTLAEFARKKIREIVEDPTVAEQLVPAKHPLGCKRPCFQDGYYEAFNRPNVHLVSAEVEPIEEVEPNCVRTSKANYPLDSLVCATGYNVMTGPLLAMDIRGRNGRSLKDEWANGAGTYLGLAIAGFPNLFVITGPGSPFVISVVLRSIEHHVDWIGDCLTQMAKNRILTIEAAEEAQTAWMNLVNNIASQTVFTKGNSRGDYDGDNNTEAKPRPFLSFLGFSAYKSQIDKVANNDYEGFVMSPGAAIA